MGSVPTIHGTNSMKRAATTLIAKLIFAVFTIACGPLDGRAQTILIPAAEVDSGRYGYTKADVAFSSPV